MFLCSKQPVKNEQFLVPTNHFFGVTIVNYLPLAFRKCISYMWCNSSPLSHSPRNCVGSGDVTFHYWILLLTKDIISNWNWWFGPPDSTLFLCYLSGVLSFWQYSNDCSMISACLSRLSVLVFELLSASNLSSKKNLLWRTRAPILQIRVCTNFPCFKQICISMKIWVCDM